MDTHGHKSTQVDSSGHKWMQVDTSGRKWTQVDKTWRKWRQVDTGDWGSRVREDHGLLPEDLHAAEAAQQDLVVLTPNPQGLCSSFLFPPFSIVAIPLELSFSSSSSSVGLTFSPSSSSS